VYYKDIIVTLMFGCLGFFLSYYIVRAVSIAVIILMTWVAFRVVENYGLKPDWHLFNNLNDLLLRFGKGFFELLTSTLSMAATGGLVLFVLGGLMGFLAHLRLRGGH
jgi:hypothetical protein